MEENPIKKNFFLLKLQTEIEEHILPKRKLPEHKRQKNISNKYKNNQKIVFKKLKFLQQKIYAFL